MPKLVQDVTDAEARLTGKKFCSHHQGMVSVSEGSMVIRGKAKRWICHSCQKKQVLRPNRLT